MTTFEPPPDKPVNPKPCQVGDYRGSHHFDATVIGPNEPVIFCRQCGEVRPLVLPDA